MKTKCGCEIEPGARLYTTCEHGLAWIFNIEGELELVPIFGMRITTMNKRIEYWNHFIEQFFVEGHGGGHGVTGPRLRKVKEIILNDDVLWQDILDRHGGRDRLPLQMAADSPGTYDHCEGNFWGMVIGVMHNYGVIK